MKKQNDKQRLFENMIKLNPELKNNTYLNENVLNEVDDMQSFLSDLGFTDMYYQYKDDPQQLERIFTKILQGRNLKKFQKLLHPEGPAVVQQEPQKQEPTIEAFVQALPEDFPQKMENMINKYGEDSIEHILQNELEEIGGEIGVTNDEEARMFLNMLDSDRGKFVTLVDKRFGKKNMGWWGDKYTQDFEDQQNNMLNESTAPKLNEEFGGNTDDPTKEEMVGFLTQQFQGFLDPQEVEGNNFDMETAIYWFANHYHGGQSSNLYSVLSTSDYHPSQMERSITDLEDGTATMMYQELVSKYGGQKQQYVAEDISIDVKVGDTIMTGRFKNSPTVVKSIGKDEHGMPTINGKKVVTFKKGIAKDESVNETVDTWENSIAPSNQEHFAKQAQGLGISPQEMYDEMKTQEVEDDSRMQLNEAELSREDMMAALKAKFGLSHVDTTENFDGTEGGIWLSGENGETAKDGRELFDYYSTDYNKYEFGVHNDFNNFADKNGWYAEWNDPGTLMVWSNSMEENKVMDEENVQQGTGVKFRAEVTGKGENRWSGNAIEYDTEEEAKEWLNNLANRWFGYDMSRVVPMTVPTGQQVDMENDIIYQNFRN